MAEPIRPKFMWRVVDRAWHRQSKKDSKGNAYARCAKCGKYLFPLFEGRDVKGGWYAVPRIPIAMGGNKKIENCVVLCPECFKEAGQDANKVIPYSELPYFEDC
jgi:hypothetical protein